MDVARRRDERSIADAGFDAFYRCEVVGQVRRAALLVGSDEAANDVVHEALANVYERWGELDDPGPYLNRAVLNGCRDRARRYRTHVRLLERLGTRSALSAEPDVISDVLSRLPFNQRAAVVLRYYGGYSTAEIAAELDCPVGSVGPWIDRALRSLRKALR